MAMPTNYNYLDMLAFDIPFAQTVLPLEIVAWSTNWALVNFLPPPFIILVVVAKLESSLPTTNLLAFASVATVQHARN